MFEKFYERWKSEARGTLRLLALAAASAGAAAIALGFLCAAGFIYALDRFGLVDACLIGAAVFIAATLILLAVYLILAASRRREERARAAVAAPPSSPLADPRLVLLAVQIVQAIGVKRLIPLLALGAAGFALASGAKRGRSNPGARAK
ncbi:MAG TPA: hypothetical protein VFE63_14150 [Roseiarcus sp.]|nr:hypothetical protein [Roseiarcus sp.]